MTLTHSVHSFFTQKPVGSAGVPGPSRGQFEDSPPSLIHYTHKDPLTSPPPADPVVVILYDLDGTLIKTSSGAKFPKSREDWMWWNDLVPKRLKEDIKTGKHVVILSNQGDGRPKIRREWKAKLPLIAEKVSCVHHLIGHQLTRSWAITSRSGSWRPWKRTRSASHIRACSTRSSSSTAIRAGRLVRRAS